MQIDKRSPQIGFRGPDANAWRLMMVLGNLGISLHRQQVGFYRTLTKTERNLKSMYCRGVRGATSVDENSSEAILDATRQLLALIIRRNGIEPADVCSAIFTTTNDLNAQFPALAARQLGWLDVPLICTNEIDVPGSLRMCIRILIHWNTEKTQNEIKHVYVKNAEKLRPDLTNLPPVDMQDLEQWIAEQMSRKTE